MFEEERTRYDKKGFGPKISQISRIN